MNLKMRKDNKGRVLKTGESQRADGRYMYRYKDPLTGKRISIYDIDLARLREKEKDVAKNIDSHLITDTAVRKLTVNDLFERYMATKDIRDKTKHFYYAMWNCRVRDTIGNIKVVDFKTSHIRIFFSNMAKEGLSHGTIKKIYILIKPAFDLAVEDGIIPKNPVAGTLGDYGYKAKEKVALTMKQQENLFAFVAENSTYNIYLPMLQIMIGTCMRVGETIGLKWSDVDLKNREVHVTGQLVYYKSDNGYGFHESETKTGAGVRTIPMTQTVYEAFLMQKEYNLMLGRCSKVEIDGKNNYVFNTKHGRPIMPSAVNSFLKNIVNAYNNQEMKKASDDKREPELMPHISAHILRHTGCTRLSECNINPKVMQYILGHSDIDVTMNIYSHIVDMNQVKTELLKIDSFTNMGNDTKFNLDA